MNLFRIFLLFVFIFTINTQNVFAYEYISRGAHCQPPSCLGAPVHQLNFCAGRWTCAIQHDRHARPEMDPPYICIHFRHENPDEICCKNGKEVPNCKRNEKGEMIIKNKESEDDLEKDSAVEKSTE